LVGGDSQTGTINKLGLTEEEKEDIVSKMDKPGHNVYPVRSKVAINRFVEDFAKLQLSQEYLHQYFLIGNMYGIPRDVLEAYNSSTYENQEKARAAHVNYTLDPKGYQFMDSYEVHFGYRDQKKNIYMSWDHLPFMQVFANEQAEVKRTTVEVLNSLLDIGVSIDNANEFLGTQFELEPPEDIADSANSPETLAAQAQLRGSVGGVQGILAIQQSVAQGTTDYDAAIGILTVVYGFTD